MKCVDIFKPAVEPRVASTSRDVTASTSEAAAANVTAPSTSTAPQPSPPSAGAAPPHTVNDLNDASPSQQVLTNYPRRVFG